MNPRSGEEGPDELSGALQEAEDRLSALEAFHGPRTQAVERARALLAQVVKRRNRVQQRGVPMWDSAQRAALRMVLLAVGSAAMISGAMALEGALGTVAIVVAMGVLVLEGLR